MQPCGDSVDARSSPVPVGEDERGTALDGLADQSTVEHGDSRGVAGCPHGLVGDVEAAVDGRGRAESGRDRRGRLLVGDDVGGQRRAQLTAVAPRIDGQDVDHPGTLGVAAVLGRVLDARRQAGLRHLCRKGLRPGHVDECARADHPPEDRAVGSPLRGGIRPRLETGRFELGGEGVPLRRCRGERDRHGPTVLIGAVAPHDLGVHEARLQAAGGALLGQVVWSQRQWLGGQHRRLVPIFLSRLCCRRSPCHEHKECRVCHEAGGSHGSLHGWSLPPRGVRSVDGRPSPTGRQ
jgi:hypothetical protein